MYSRKSWGGNEDPFILTKLIKPDGVSEDAIVSLVVFEWSDKNLIGHPTEEENEYGFDTVSGTQHAQVCRALTARSAAIYLRST